MDKRVVANDLIENMVNTAEMSVYAWDGRNVSVYASWLDDDNLVINCRRIDIAWEGREFVQYANSLVRTLGSMAGEILNDHEERPCACGEWVAHRSELNYYDANGNETEDEDECVTTQCSINWMVNTNKED